MALSMGLRSAGLLAGCYIAGGQRFPSADRRLEVTLGSLERSKARVQAIRKPCPPSSHNRRRAALGCSRLTASPADIDTLGATFYGGMTSVGPVGEGIEPKQMQRPCKPSASHSIEEDRR